MQAQPVSPTPAGYLCIDAGLQLHAVAVRPKKGLAVRAVSGASLFGEVYCNGHIHDGLDLFLSELIDEAMGRSMDTARSLGCAQTIGFLTPNWLRTLALVMWRGIIGGYDWDTIKAMLPARWKRLQDAGVAPPRAQPGDAGIDIVAALDFLALVYARMKSAWQSMSRFQRDFLRPDWWSRWPHCEALAWRLRLLRARDYDYVLNLKTFQ